MTTAPFQLESLLRLRRQQVRQVEQELMQCQAVLHRWQDKELQIQQSIADLSAETANFDALTSERMMAVQAELDGRFRALQEARRQQKIAHEKLLEVRNEHRHMRVELEKVTTLKDEHLRGIKKQLARYESNQLSEIPLRDWKPGE